MSHEPDKPDGTRWKRGVWIALFLGSVGIAVTVLCMWRPRWVLGDFSALWNTTDAIVHYVEKKREWPRDWESLSSSLASVDPSFANGDTSFARDRVDVNFQIDFKAFPSPDDWYVRLKDGHGLPGEGRMANERIRSHLSAAKGH
jgi:hypothetical protein